MVGYFGILFIMGGNSVFFLFLVREIEVSEGKMMDVIEGGLEGVLGVESRK